MNILLPGTADNTEIHEHHKSPHREMSHQIPECRNGHGQWIHLWICCPQSQLLMNTNTYYNKKLERRESNTRRQVGTNQPQGTPVSACSCSALGWQRNVMPELTKPQGGRMTTWIMHMHLTWKLTHEIIWVGKQKTAISCSVRRVEDLLFENKIISMSLMISLMHLWLICGDKLLICGDKQLL